MRIAQIRLANSGCAATGGQLFTSLRPVTWRPAGMPGTSRHSEGTIDGIDFSVAYQAGTGWTALIFAR